MSVGRFLRPRLLDPTLRSTQKPVNEQRVLENPGRKVTTSRLSSGSRDPLTFPQAFASNLAALRPLRPRLLLPNSPTVPRTATRTWCLGHRNRPTHWRSPTGRVLAVSVVCGEYLRSRGLLIVRGCVLFQPYQLNSRPQLRTAKVLVKQA